MAWRIPRFTTLQLLLTAALCGIILGLITSSWRAAAYSRITAIAFSPNGATLAARYPGGGFQAWRMGPGQPRLIAQTRMESIRDDRWAPVRFGDDRTLIDLRAVIKDGVASGEVRSIDLRTSTVETIMTLPNVGWVPPFAAASDHVAVANWSSGSIDCYRIGEQRLARQVKGVVNSPFGLDLTPDGSRLAFFDQDGTLRVVDTTSGDEIRSVVSRGICVAEISRDSRRLATADYVSGNVELLNLETNKPPDRLAHKIGFPQWLAFTANGKRLAIGSFDAVELYDLDSSARLSRILLDDQDRPLSFRSLQPYSIGWQQLALSPDGKTLAAVDGGQVALWDFNSGKVRATLTGGQRNAQIVIFTLGLAAWSVSWGLVNHSQSERDRRDREDHTLQLHAAPIIPVELKLCWGLMVIGGLVAIGATVGVLMIQGPIVWPPVYLSLFVGVIAVSAGVARRVERIHRVAALQMCNLAACDPVNFLLGLLAHALLRRPHVQHFLRQANSADQRTTPASVTAHAR